MRPPRWRGPRRSRVPAIHGQRTMQRGTRQGLGPTGVPRGVAPAGTGPGTRIAPEAAGRRPRPRWMARRTGRRAAEKRAWQLEAALRAGPRSPRSLLQAGVQRKRPGGWGAARTHDPELLGAHYPEEAFEFEVTLPRPS